MKFEILSRNLKGGVGGGVLRHGRFNENMGSRLVLLVEDEWYLKKKLSGLCIIIGRSEVCSDYDECGQG